MTLNHTGWTNYTKSMYDLMLMNFDFGLKDYEIFDEAYRPILNDAILQAYKFKEIGYTNPLVFKDRLNYKMSLIMRNKYNALYKAKMIEFNPLYNVEMHETFTHTVDTTGQSTNNGTIDFTTNNTNNTTSNNKTDVVTSETSNQSAVNTNVTSQYPSEEMIENDFDSNIYVDGGAKIKTTQNASDDSEQSNESNGTVNNTLNGIDKTINANNGSSKNITTETYQKDTVGSSAGLPFSRAMTQLKDYLDEFQLDQQVIDELSDLFMNVW